MLKIHGYAASINVRKVLWVCAEIGLSFEREDWGGAYRPTSDPAFKALNSAGMVPVIDDGGVIVWESNTIVRYLAASRGRADLLPVQPAARARVEQWMDWQASDFNNSWRVAFQGLVRRNPAFQEPRAIEASLSQFSTMVGMVDAQLARTGAYIAGADFTVADIAIGLSLRRWNSIPVTRPAYPNVERYYETLLTRSGFQRYGRDGGS
ncbi:MAG: glutathione S-transferase [Proteobacteria bacterium]|nr:glutathione S-transferase [Pseudomonadota bacterium]